jgi:hypothetical protein
MDQIVARTARHPRIAMTTGHAPNLHRMDAFVKTTTLAQIVALIAPPVALVMEAGNVQRMASRANVTKCTMVTIAAPIVVLKDKVTPRVTPLRW